MTTTSGQAQRFLGLKILVTGGARGLGEAAVRRFASEGGMVYIADIDEDAAHALAKEIEGSVALALDVTSESSWAKVVEQVTPGGLDCLVNNAGIGDLGTIEEASFESFQRLMRINVDSVFLGCKMFLPLLKESKRASIVNMSSVAALIAGGNMAGYNASKAAVAHLSRSVAIYCAERKYNVTCNSVLPCFVKTAILAPLQEKHGDAIYEKLARQIPLGRLGEPEEIAGAVTFLASADARFITGSDLVVDGGASAR